MPNSLALQLHSLRHEAAVNAEDVVRSVPSLGFDAIETAEAYGWSADQWKNILTETKLRILGAHVGLETLEKEWDSQINFQRAIGNERLVVTALPRNLQTPEGYSEAAGRLNSLGDRAKSAGFALLYHNHAYEFLPFADGRCGMDILLAETDPQLVSFEVDTYWVERAGATVANSSSKTRHASVCSTRRNFAAMDAMYRRDRVTWIGKSSSRCCEAAAVRSSSSTKQTIRWRRSPPARDICANSNPQPG